MVDPEDLHDSISEICRPEGFDDAVLAGYDLSMEWVAPDGTRILSHQSHEGSTSWQRLGYAMESVIREIGIDMAYRVHGMASVEEEEDEYGV